MKKFLLINGFDFSLDLAYVLEDGKSKKELKGGFKISNSVSYDVPEVSIFYTNDNERIRWEYRIRDDWKCVLSPFRYAGSYVKSQPANTAVSNLKPNESIYMITVADSVVNNAKLELMSGTRLKRKAFKMGTGCCEGFTNTEVRAYSTLPYDSDPSHYAGGKFPWDKK